MKTKLLNKLPVGFVGLFIASAAFAWTWGSPGQDGNGGNAGSSGRSASTVQVVADGTPVLLDLHGLDGSRGSNGGNGEDARSCDFYQSDYSMEGADGGSGGNGGSGGSGGDGGDLYAFYNDPSLLKSIAIRNPGGRASYGGAGGTGGRGCKCTYSSWQVKKCTTQSVDGQQQEVCTDQTVYCSDGRDGSSGSHGANGLSGSYGNIHLLRGLNEVPADAPTATVALSLAAETPTPLSKKHWLELAGARSLFAQGSDISDSYFEFDQVRHTQAIIEWNAPRPVSDFAAEKVGFTFDGEKVSHHFTDGIWSVVKKSIRPDATVFSVEAAIRDSEAGQIALGGIEGSGEDLKIVLKDRLAVSQLVNTSATITLKTASFLGILRNRYSDEIPSKLIEVVSPSQINLLIGKLPGIKHPDKAFASGRKIRFELYMIRSLSSRATRISLESPKKAKIQ